MSLDTSRIGTDLDIPTSPGEAIPITASGDIALLAGTPALDRSQLRRLVTEPGAMLYHPAYGVGLVGRLGAANSPIERGRLASLARVNLLRDPRVKDVAVTVSASSDEDHTVTIGITRTLQDDTRSTVRATL